MIITLNQKLNRLEVITRDPTEYKLLKRFPGLLRDEPCFFAPLEPRITYNLVSRLRKKYTKIQVDPEVDEYLNKPFKLKEIPAEFKFYTTPKNFQEIPLRYMYTTKGGGLLLEPGMGKTKVVLDFIALMGFKKSLIVCPLPLLFVWEDEQKIHRPDKSIYCVESTDWKEEKTKVESADIVVINYNKAVLLLEDLVDQGFEFIGVDEALIKDPSSGRTKALTWLGRHIKHRMLMSGTLINNSPLDAFAPIRFLEPSLVGGDYYNYENEYAVKVGAIGKKFVVGYREGSIPEIKSTLESVSIVMTKDKWLNLPPKKFVDLWVQPSEEQRKAYWDLQSNYIANIGDKTLEVESPLTVLCKLIQISNGFVYLNKEDNLSEIDGTQKVAKKVRETYFFPEQPKINRLMQLLDDLKGRRAMIWYNMQGEYELISKALQNRNIQHGSNIKWLHIGGGEKATGDKVRTFNRDSSYSYLLCQSKAVNYGITVLGQEYEEGSGQCIGGITSVFTQIFYSLNFSLEVYLQQLDRIHRLGQNFECEYFRLWTNFPAEKHIKEKIDEKQSIRGMMLQDMIERLGIRKVS